MRRLILTATLATIALALASFAAAGDGKARSASGVVTALSSTSITVQPDKGDALTCAVPLVYAVVVSVQASVGSRVAVVCVPDGHRLVLRKLRVNRPSSGPPPPAPSPAKTALGLVTAVSSDSLTVKPESGDALTCSVPASLAAAVANLHVGDRVGIACERSVLLRVSVAPSGPAPTPAPALQTSASGVVTALSSDSLTVKPDSGDALTCSLSLAVAEAVSKLHVGDRAGIGCEQHEGHWVLVKISVSTTLPPPATRSVTGSLYALSLDRIAVKAESGDGASCFIPTNLRDSVAALHLAVGDHVSVTCTLVGTQVQLVSVARA